MGNNKPQPQVRKPPSDDDKVTAFISGDDTNEQTASSDENADVDASDPGIVELEDGTLKRRMTVYLDPDDGKTVKVLAALENRKISDVLAEAVEAYLNGRELPDL